MIRRNRIPVIGFIRVINRQPSLLLAHLWLQQLTTNVDNYACKTLCFRSILIVQV